MSYSNPNVNITYDGNGSDSSFGVNFYYLEGVTASIQVELWNYTNPEVPVKESFVLGVDYTIDESSYPNTLVNTTDPVAIDYKLIIQRLTVPVQTTNFVNGAFPAESVEEAIDKAMMATQEQYEKLDRALLNPVGGPSIDIQDVLIAAEAASELADRVTQNESDISTNQSAIATNNSAIGANTSSISTNASGISTNASNITTAQSTADAAQNDLDAYKWSTSSVTGATYTAQVREIVLAKANTTITLPAVSDGAMVKVKNTVAFVATVQSADQIDGFGTSYTLSSSYESITLVSDGTTWYIV